jgi:hypothetical protein
MEWFRLVLDYVKALLTPQIVVVLGIIWFAKTFKENIAELIDRIKAIKFPGGEVSTAQFEKLKNEKPIEDKTSPEPQSADLPANIQENDTETLKTLYNAERSRAYFWEYSYLNYYLVPRTQFTLDWLVSAQPITVSLYDTLTSPSVPDHKERKAILNALENHYLVQVKDDIITVSPKGHEYIEWRTKVHRPPASNLLS